MLYIANCLRWKILRLQKSTVICWKTFTVAKPIAQVVSLEKFHGYQSIHENHKKFSNNLQYTVCAYAYLLTTHMYHMYFTILSCRLVYCRQEVMAVYHTNTQKLQHSTHWCFLRWAQSTCHLV